MMKNNILLLVVLFLAANSWSQDAPPPPPPPKRVVVDSNQVYLFVDVEAEFPGGREGLLKYLATNIQYPSSALKNKLQGKCFVQFVVERSGYVTNPKVMRGVPDCPECDYEALRVVRTMPQWKPGEVDGKPVRSSFNLPIAFKLD
jgi:protein TonB